MTEVASRLPISTAGLGRLGGVALALAAVGCSTVTTTTPDGEITKRSAEEFRLYVEDVFRRQNKLGDVLIELEAGDAMVEGPHVVAISLAEERMHDACQSLNDAAMAVAEGRDIGFVLRIKVANTITRCEYATRRLERDLNRITNESFVSNTIAL